MQNTKYYAFLVVFCAVSAVAGIALGYFIFGPMGVSAGITDYDYSGEVAEYTQRYSIRAYEPIYEVAENPVEPTHNYILTVNNGYIVVLHAGDDPTIKEITPTPVNALPPEEQERLAQGIHIYTEEALIRILEDYGS
jgi:hypothetical protein